jgi:hypothetical protein
MASGEHVWDGILDSQTKGTCTQAFPMYSTSRILAGAPFEGGVFKCRLKSVSTAITDGTYGVWKPTLSEIQKLQSIFPEGVCDYP